MSKNSILVEISSDHENAVENYLHEMKKQANEGQRYGVQIDIERVELKEGQDVVGFDAE